MMNTVKIRNGTDMNSIMWNIISVILEGSINEEMNDELGYSKCDYHKEVANSRSGYSQQTIHVSYSDIEPDISVIVKEFEQR